MNGCDSQSSVGACGSGTRERWQDFEKRRLGNSFRYGHYYHEVPTRILGYSKDVI